MGSKKHILLGLGVLLFFGALSTQAGITITSHGNTYVPLNNIAERYIMTVSQSGKEPKPTVAVAGSTTHSSGSIIPRGKLDGNGSSKRMTLTRSSSPSPAPTRF